MAMAALTVGAAGVLCVYWLWPRQPQPELVPVTVLPADLVRGYLKGSFPTGIPVRVFGRYRLAPTDDPLAFDYIPGTGAVPPTIRFHFDSPPPDQPVDQTSWVIVGVVAEFTTDLETRVSGARGVLSIRRAAYEPR